MRAIVASAAFAVCLTLVSAAASPASSVPAGAVWTEAAIQEADGTVLHADVLRPKGLPAGTRVPVIMSIGPYFNHGGQQGIAALPGGPYDPIGPSGGPSDRFYDFVNGAHLMAKGYSFVMVDLRGFGASTGCPDFFGPGEQADVSAAVEWAAGQPWSTGRVGLYGKSYDAGTGLAGVANRPRGLAAVVAQEPLYDIYDTLYSNGVRFPDVLRTPLIYGGDALSPAPLLDGLGGAVSSITTPDCLASYALGQQNPDPRSPYWRARDLTEQARGSRVPLFLTQGFLDDTARPAGAFDFFDAVSGPKRAWFGMWDHVRGNDRNAKGRLLMGRPGFFDEVMRFFDHYVAKVPLARAPTRKDPPVAVESSDGRWRSEAAWPPRDATATAMPLHPGRYLDNVDNNGTALGGSPTGVGVWTISKPVPADRHMAGVPHFTARIDPGARGANIVVDLYDIGPQAKATLISRGAALAPASGDLGFDLYGDDWIIKAGHRLGALVTTANEEWWFGLPTFKTVAFHEASVTLPMLRRERTRFIAGDRSVKLEGYLAGAPFDAPGGG